MKTITPTNSSLVAVASALLAMAAYSQPRSDTNFRFPKERPRVVIPHRQGVGAKLRLVSKAREAFRGKTSADVVWGPISKLSHDAQASGGNYTPHLVAQGDTIHCIWWMDGPGAFRLPYLRSVDNGTSWESEVDLLTDSTVSRCIAGWNQIAVDRDQLNVLFTANDCGGKGFVFFRKSSDRGKTWSNPQPATRDSTGVLFSASVYAENMAGVYVPYLNGIGQYPRIMRSSNGGASWTTNPFRMPSSSSNQLRVALTPGLLNFIHPGDMWPGPAPEIVLHRSTDLADTWKDSLVLSPIDTNGSDMPEVATYEYADCNPKTTIGVMWRGEEFGGALFSAGMAVRLSYDNGESWEPIQIVSDVPYGSFHSIAIRGNVVAVSWTHEGSDFAGPFQTKVRVSLDNGRTWGGVTNLTPQSTAWANVPSIAISNSAVHVAWEELIDGKWNIYYCRGELPRFSPALSTTSIKFDTVSVGCSRYGSLVIKNILDYSLHLSVRASNVQDYAITPDDITLCPDESAVLDVRYAPLSAGDKSAHLILFHNQSDTPDTVILNAAAIGTGGEIVLRDTLCVGWSLVSLPVQVPCSYVLPRSFLYERIYRQSDTLIPGRGYWNKLSDAKFSFAGLAVTEAEVPVEARWNLIGSISNPVAVHNIASEPPGIVTSQFYGYREHYYISDSIRPGNAYWVKVSQNGSLFLSSSASTPLASRIRLVASDEPPPSAPDPTVSSPGEGGPTARPQEPSRFALDQNYPNPFNPVTNIRYQLPVDGYVTLRVYNTLGQVVSVLVNEFQVAGFKSVEWDAGRMPSGVYFYKLTASGFSDVKKLVIVR